MKEQATQDVEPDLPIYEPPLLEEQDGMIFPEEIWQEFNDKHWCFGCTNCNCN